MIYLSYSLVHPVLGTHQVRVVAEREALQVNMCLQIARPWVNLIGPSRDAPRPCQPGRMTLKPHHQQPLRFPLIVPSIPPQDLRKQLSPSMRTTTTPLPATMEKSADSAETASITSQQPLLPPPSYEEATKPDATATGRRRLRARLRTALSDVGTPPTSRYDAAHGLETPRHVDLGMLRAAASRT
ncbi:hypothetical protein VUR80DRAFT_1018 [Thermomyces stellatus]